MANLPNKSITISVDGKKLSSFKSFHLRQAVNEHHFFEILLDYEEGEPFQTATLSSSSSWLGKVLIINIGEKKFVGVVAQVALHKSEGYTFIKVTGFSTTYRLEGEHHFASWNEKKLEDIVSELAEKANVMADVNPENRAKLEYECQYMETGFGFIKRLAKQHLEWLYYDGEKLIFGKPQLKKDATLDSKRDLYSLEISVQTGACSLASFSHISGSNKKIEALSPDEPAGLNNLGQQAFQQSLSVFGDSSMQYSSPRVSSKNELENYLKRKQQADASMSHYITAECGYVGLMLGSVVEIKSVVQISGTNYKEESLGDYVIIDITHFGEENARYTCQFTAIPASVNNLPSPEVELPIAQPQMGTVVSNNDPKGQGRVRVRMNWQVKGMQTSWLRVLSPDAGSSDKVSSNRGFVFIPEEGDQVMVGFRYNDPNRPYVQGSLFNGTNAGGGGASNNVKSLTTRSGCIVSLDDSKGSVTVKDPSGSTIILNGDKTITVASTEKISFKSKEIEIKGDKKVNIESDDILIKGQTSKVIGTKEVEVTSDVKAGVNAPVAEFEGKTSINLKGGIANVEGTTIATIKGGILNLN